MFRVILYNWYDNAGNMHAHEIPIMVINPLSTYKWIDDNGNVLIDENGNSVGGGAILDDKPCMINPSIKEDMGKAPSFDFTLNPGMAYYNAYRVLKTLIRIDYGTDWNDSNKWKTIFFGRVVSISTSSLRQVKSIHSEGFYTAFADTVQEGIEEDFQTKKNAYQLFQEIIAVHNSQVGGEWWKLVSLDEAVCNVDTDTELKKRDSSSWQTTQSALNQLVSNNGGYMRIRVAHGARDGIPFKLDWYKKYYRDLDEENGPGHRPCFELAKNILDLSSSQTLEELFTRVIPIGHKASASGSSTSDSEYTNSSQKKERTMIYLEPRVINVESINPGTDEDLLERFQSRDEFTNAYNYYGNIYKTVNFPNAYNKDLLAQYANDWVKKNYYGAIKSFTVKAVDMKMVGETDNTDDIIMAGDCVDIIYPIFDQNGNRTLSTKRRLVCKSVQINLYNPEQNSYSIGVPNDAIDFEYGQKKKTGRASTTAAAAGAERPAPPPRTYELDSDKVARYLYWFYYSNNWGTIETAQKNNAYSWRTGGRGLENLINLLDKKPHDTFKAYGMPKHTWREYEEVEVIEYDEGYPEDPDHIRSRRNEFQWVTHTEFYHVLIDGISKPVRVMGRYITSPLKPIRNRFDQETSLYFASGVIPHGRNTDSERNKVKWGYVYGFGWVEGTTDAVAFEWADYLAKQYPNANPETNPIPALFHYPNLFGRYVEQSGLSDTNSETSPGTGASNTGQPDNNGVITYYDENGQPSAQIFPDSGRASYGPAIEHYNPETGEVVEPDPTTGEYPPGTATRQKRDPESGTPIFFTTINTPLYDSEGHVIVEAGGISTTDIQLPGIASFKTEIAVINNLIAERATIGELRAFTAMFGDSVPHDKIDPETGEVVIDPETGQPVKTYEGTQMDITTNGILGVSGLFAKNPDGTIKTGTGGVILVNKNGTEIGLWDKGELSAGMFTERDANGTYTGIVGDKVVVTPATGHGRLSVEDLATWAKDPKSGHGGLFSKFIVAKEITVGTLHATDDSIAIDGNIEVKGGGAVFGTWNNGNGAYTFINHDTIISNNYSVKNGGAITFAGNSGQSSSSSEIDYTDSVFLNTMVDESGNRRSHVAITQDDTTGVCTLWHLPAGIPRTGADANPPTGSSSNNWVNAGTFRKAASSSSEIYLYGSWSSGVPSVFTAYTTNIPDRYGAHIKEFNIVFDNQNAEAYDHLTVNHGSITINANNTIDIPITVDSVEYSDGGADDDQYITRYSKTITGIDVSSVVASVGVKYLGSYTPSGASEPIHAVVPTTDSGKYNYIEISVDEGSLVNEGTTSGYRRVKVNAAGNGQTTPTAIKEWRINDYGTGYSAVTVTKVAIADNLGVITDDALRPINIFIRGTASNTKFLDATFHLGIGTAGTHRVVNLLQADPDVSTTNYVIGRINVDSVYNAGVQSVGVKYLGSYTPSGASEPIHAVVPTTDSGKYNYIEISVDEGSLINEGTDNGYRRVKVNAAGNGQAIPTAIKEWRISDYGDGYSAGYGAVRLSTSWVNSDTQLQISKSTSGSTGPLTFGVSATPSLIYNTITHKYTAYARAKINGTEHGDAVASEPSGLEAYNAGWDYGAATAFSTGATKITSPTSAQISSATQLDANAYYTINIKGKNHSNTNVDGTDLIVKTPSAPQIQITDEWSDGVYTVKNGSTILASTTLSSQMTASGNPTQCTASGASDSTGKYVKQNYIVNYEAGNDVTSTGRIVTAIVSASSVFDAGYNSARLTETWTNGSGTTAAQLVIDKTDSTSGSYTFPKTHNFTVRFNDLVNTGTSSGRRTVSILSDGTEIYTSSYIQDYGIGYSRGLSTGRTNYEPNSISQDGSTITVLNAAGNSVGTFTVSISSGAWLDYNATTAEKNACVQSIAACQWIRLYDDNSNTIYNGSVAGVWRTPTPWAALTSDGSGWDSIKCGTVPYYDPNGNKYFRIIDQNNSQTIYNDAVGAYAIWKLPDAPIEPTLELTSYRLTATATMKSGETVLDRQSVSIPGFAWAGPFRNTTTMRQEMGWSSGQGSQQTLTSGQYYAFEGMTSSGMSRIYFRA